MSKSLMNIIAAFTFVLLLTGCSDVGKVKYSRWNGSDITLGSALEKFFETSEWESHKIDDGVTMVEFKGHNKFVSIKDTNKGTIESLKRTITITFALNADKSISVISIVKEENVDGVISKKDYSDKKDEIMNDYGRGISPAAMWSEESENK